VSRLADHELVAFKKLLVERLWYLDSEGSRPLHNGITFIAPIPTATSSEPLDVTITSLIEKNRNLVEVTDGVWLSAKYVLPEDVGHLLLTLRKDVAAKFLSEHELFLRDPDMLLYVHSVQDHLNFIEDVRMAIGERHTLNTIEEKKRRKNEHCKHQEG